MKALLPAAASMLLVACAGAGYGYANSNYAHRLPPGTQVMVTQAISIPGGGSGTYFQGGREVTPMQVVSWSDACSVHPGVPQDQAVEVQPGEYRIVKTGANQIGVEWNTMEYNTNLTLESASGGGTLRISCTRRVFEPDRVSNPGTYITVARLNEAFGDYLKVPTPAQ